MTIADTSNPFFDHPILNSPYDYPLRHWELDDSGQPTQRILESRRPADFITPIPKSKKRESSGVQARIVFDEGKGLSTKGHQYDVTSIINDVRQQVNAWRTLPPSQWQVTPETARLLQHWRGHRFGAIRPFFCQIEAVETAIWLTEVAPNSKPGQRLISYLASANKDANPELERLALKLATGAGKTTVMAMLIAWQTINSVRRPGSKHFTRGFLVVAPGLTIKDRLRVLQPNDPDSYYASRELVPTDLLDDIKRAKIVITNYHTFKLRERIGLSAGGRALLKGPRGADLQTSETEGQMLQRVMPDLMGMKNILVLNDEAHHCYREKPADPDDAQLKGDERVEAEKNNEAARLWISGLEAVNRKLGLGRVIDLSATPFFLRGSGYAEGTLFPWTMSDFSLMDAIECGIVKLPRVPVAENIPGDEMPVYRNLWEHIRKGMPKKGRGKGGDLDPLKLPTRLQTALEALYGHYAKTFKLWQEQRIPIPPCFIIVCQNTSISKLVYDYVSGFHRRNEDGSSTLENGRLALFRNFDETTGNPLPRPSTLLIDSEQLEAGDALDPDFRQMAADEIERFRREIIERTGDVRAAEKLSDQDLLREVMNTVGKVGQLGADIRCVVSVSMLTEGWDASNVTHILGIRAFGTQLLCEQVIGRALRRQSYDLNDEGLFDAEYADIFGVPFDFTAKPVVAPPKPPVETVLVKAVRPDRDALEIRFPRVEGYRVELPEERLTASFNDDSILELTPDIVGPSITRNSGIIGEGVDLDLKHLGDTRRSTLLFCLTQRLLYTKWRDAGEDPKFHLFGQLKRITKQWLDTCLVCKGGTYPAQLVYQELADIACNRITAGITRALEGTRPIKALLDPYNPTGSTAHVRFTTSRKNRWDTAGPPPKNHVNWVVFDSDWEAEFCRVAERIDISSLDALGLRLHKALPGSVKLAEPQVVRDLMREALGEIGDHRFSPSFLMTEWEQVVDGWQLQTWEAYRDVARLGRKTRLSEAQRKTLWVIFERVRDALRERDLTTRAAVFEVLAASMSETRISPYDHAVIDEAQDVSVTQMRFLAAMLGDRPNGLFFAGDLGQRIFQQPFSWRSLGVEIRGRSRTLRVNYRTSHQIRQHAGRTPRSHYTADVSNAIAMDSGRSGPVGPDMLPFGRAALLSEIGSTGTLFIRFEI